MPPRPARASPRPACRSTASATCPVRAPDPARVQRRPDAGWPGRRAAHPAPAGPAAPRSGRRAARPPSPGPPARSRPGSSAPATAALAVTARTSAGVTSTTRSQRPAPPPGPARATGPGRATTGPADRGSLDDPHASASGSSDGGSSTASTDTWCQRGRQSAQHRRIQAAAAQPDLAPPRAGCRSQPSSTSMPPPTGSQSIRNAAPAVAAARAASTAASTLAPAPPQPPSTPIFGCVMPPP